MKFLIPLVLLGIFAGCASAPPPAPFDWQKEFAGYWVDPRERARPRMVFRYPYMWEFISNEPGTFRVYASELRYIGSDGKKIVFAMHSLGNIDHEWKKDNNGYKQGNIEFIYMFLVDNVVDKWVAYDVCDTPNSDSISVAYFDTSYPELIAKYRQTKCAASEAISSGSAYSYSLSRNDLWQSEILQVIAPDLLPPEK